MERAAILEVARMAAREAGQDALARLGRPRDVRRKGLRDLVTDADLGAQEILLRHIHARFPGHGILSEESVAEERGEITWILDPIDGTSNYAHGLACFAISVGVVDGEGPLVGVVYDPVRDQLFEACRGAGASLNGEPLVVSTEAEPIDALVALDFAREEHIRRGLIDRVGKLAPHVHSFRAMGSAALGLCYVAAGWIEAYFHVVLAPWDSAAAVLIIREAGGRVTRIDGTPWAVGEPTCLASNGRVHDALVALLR